MANSAKSADLEGWFKPCTDKILELDHQHLDDSKSMLSDTKSRIEIDSILTLGCALVNLCLGIGACGRV